MTGSLGINDDRNDFKEHITIQRTSSKSALSGVFFLQTGGISVDGRNPKQPPGMYKTFVYGIFTVSAGRVFLPSTVLFEFTVIYFMFSHVQIVQSHFGSFRARHPSTARLLGDLKLYPEDSQDEMRGLKISVPFSRIKKVFYSMIFC